MAYFDGIRVGDRVYDMRWGWATVSCVDYNWRFGVEVEFKGSFTENFTFDGLFIDGGPQTLFWDKPEFTPPPRPKRKVKKTIELWGLVNPKTDDVWVLDSHEDAEYLRHGSEHSCVVPITGEYEVEE